MHITNLVLSTLLGVFLISNTFAFHIAPNEISAPGYNNNKRDLLSGLLPPLGQPQNGSPAPPTSSSSNPGSSTSNITPTPTGSSDPLPSIISGVLGSPNPSSSSTPAAPTTQPKRKPGPGTTDPSQGTAVADDPSAAASTNNAKDGSTSSGLSPSLITFIVIIILAIVCAVVFSCYKIRQARRRRHESWTENILKNHTGGVGYTEGGGYGMYVGNGNDRPDIWGRV